MLSRCKDLVRLMQEEKKSSGPSQWAPTTLCAVSSLLSFVPVLVFLSLIYNAIFGRIQSGPLESLLTLLVVGPATIISSLLLGIAFLQGKRMAQDPDKQGGVMIKIYSATLIILNLLSLGACLVFYL
jgi:hypothetical protein